MCIGHNNTPCPFAVLLFVNLSSTYYDGSQIQQQTLSALKQFQVPALRPVTASGNNSSMPDMPAIQAQGAGKTSKCTVA